LLLDVIGYLAFWLAYANYSIFGVVKIIVLAFLLIHFAILIFRGRLQAYLSLLGEPLLFVSLFFSAVLLLGFSNGGLDAPHITAATRFSHALPVDNVIPLIFADALKLGIHPVKTPGFGWDVAFLSKIKIFVYGHEFLAQSCK
jgi:hypothetical protein